MPSTYQTMHLCPVPGIAGIPAIPGTGRSPTALRAVRWANIGQDQKPASNRLLADVEVVPYRTAD